MTQTRHCSTLLLSSIGFALAALTLLLSPVHTSRASAAVTAPSVLNLPSNEEGFAPALPTIPLTSTRYVATTGTDTGDCTDPGNPCHTIQYAVDQACEGDAVRVAAGRYTDVHSRPRQDVASTGTVNQILYITKTITVEGGYTTTNDFAGQPDPQTNPTTLDPANQGRGVYISGGISPTLRGFQITRGDATAGGGDNRGGGIHIYDSSARIDANHIYQNSAGQHGGGVCLFLSDALLSNNTIEHNTASESGGGLYITTYSTATLVANVIASNTASAYNGGGLCLWASAPVAERNLFAGNHAGRRGGAVYMDYLSDGVFTNNVFVGSQAPIEGSGIFVARSSPRFIHSTIADNQDARSIGIFVADYGTPRANVSLTNTVLVSHSLGISITGESTVTLNGILWDAGTPITVSQSAPATVAAHNQYTGDPAFVDPSTGDYHIRLASAAIGRGLPTPVSDDIDGDPRPLGAAPDLGADETGLRVSKQASPSVVEAGSTLSYTIAVTNYTHTPLHTLVADHLPSHLADSGLKTWSPTIAASGATWLTTFTTTVDLGYSGPLTNVVKVLSTEGPTGIFTETSQSHVTPALTLTVSASPDPVSAGNPLTYTLTVTNTGNVGLVAAITDTLPLRVSPPSPLHWSGVSIVPHAAWSHQVLVTPTLGYAGTLTNVLTVTTDLDVSGVYTNAATVICHRVYLPLVVRTP